MIHGIERRFDHRAGILLRSSETPERARRGRRRRRSAATPMDPAPPCGRSMRANALRGSISSRFGQGSRPRWRVHRADQAEVADGRRVAEQEAMCGEMGVERVEHVRCPALEQRGLLGHDADAREIAAHRIRGCRNRAVAQEFWPARQQRLATIALEQRVVLGIAPARMHRDWNPPLIAPGLQQIGREAPHRRRGND